MRQLCREAVANGWSYLKMKVGANLDEDVRRAHLIRAEMGWQRKLMMDANQVWDVGAAIAHMQHLSIFDYICVSASLENRVVEFVDHLHEHFLDPVTIKNGRYMPPGMPGYSITMRQESLSEYEYPIGKAWTPAR